jgi:hypothetical protein
MGGQWSHRRDSAAHKRARDALLPGVIWGVTLCYRCKHPLEAGDLIELDHAEDGSYGGFSHGRSPCRVCGKRCNAASGGVKAALQAGKRLRSRACVICGKNFTASQGTDGANAATCGQRTCLNELRRIRKQRLPDPVPPAQTGRPW